MDLKIKDVAELLNVSETTIRRWLVDTKNTDPLPAYLINHQYRFNRVEVERWVMRRRQNIEKSDEKTDWECENTEEQTGIGRSGSLQYSLYRALHKGNVVDGISGHNKSQVIHGVMEKVADALGLDANGLTDLLLDRERLQSTSLGHGIALPHTRDFLLNRAYDIVIIAYPEHPLEFEALDGLPVHTLIFLFASDDKRHLHLLSKIAYLASQPSAIEMLRSRPNKETLLEYIKQWESSIQKK